MACPLNFLNFMFFWRFCNIQVCGVIFSASKIQKYPWNLDFLEPLPKVKFLSNHREHEIWIFEILGTENSGYLSSKRTSLRYHALTHVPIFDHWSVLLVYVQVVLSLEYTCIFSPLVLRLDPISIRSILCDPPNLTISQKKKKKKTYDWTTSYLLLQEMVLGQVLFFG